MSRKSKHLSPTEVESFLDGFLQWINTEWADTFMVYDDITPNGGAVTLAAIYTERVTETIDEVRMQKFDILLDNVANDEIVLGYKDYMSPDETSLVRITRSNYKDTINSIIDANKEAGILPINYQWKEND